MAQAELSVLIHAKDEASHVMQGVGNSADNMSKKLKYAGMGMMAAGAGITAMMGSAVKSAAEEEAGITRLSVAMENMGISYSEVEGSLESWIDAQQQKTSIADDAQRSSLASLIRMTGDLTEAQDLLTLAMDVSVGTNRDLESATNLLMYAMGGNWGMLERYIPALKNAQDEEQKWTMLREMFAGQAEEYGQTMQGQFDLLMNNIGDIKETIGSFVATAIRPLIDRVQTVVQGLKAWAAEHPQLAQTITIIVAVLGALLIPLGAILMVLPTLAAGWTMLTSVISLTTIKTIAHTAATVAHNVAMGAAKIAMVAATAAQWALNAAMSANPIGLIILAIAGLVAGIIALVKNWDKVIAALKVAWNWFVQLKNTVVDFVKNAIDWLKARLEALIKPFKTLFGWISTLIGHSPGVVMLEEEMTGLANTLPTKQTKEFTETALKPTYEQTEVLIDAMRRFNDQMRIFESMIRPIASKILESLVTAYERLRQTLDAATDSAWRLYDALRSVVSAQRASGTSTGSAGGGGGGGGGVSYCDAEEMINANKSDWYEVSKAKLESMDEATKQAIEDAGGSSGGGSSSTITPTTILSPTTNPVEEMQDEIEQAVNEAQNTFDDLLSDAVILPQSSFDTMVSGTYTAPAFQHGGVMPFSGLAYLHRGETVLPNNAIITLPIYLDSELIGERVVELVGSKARLRGL